MRGDNRRADELRLVKVIPHFTKYAEGSVLIAMGSTQVLCNLSVEEGVPRWMQVQNKPGGWITAEYSMLPRATHQRTPREERGPGGRTMEIRRLIGRSLRAAANLEQLGPLTLMLDCDVLQADGGTRTAAITGGWLALAIALRRLELAGRIPPGVLKGQVAAISVGIVGRLPVLDLNYEEDRTAEVDANLVMNDHGEYIEVQGTAEGEPFPRRRLDELLDLGYRGIGELFAIQRKTLDTLHFEP